MATLQSWKYLIPTAYLAMIFGLMVSVRLWIMMILNPRTFFHTKKRLTRPAVMEDPALGRHGLVQLPDGSRLHTVENGRADAPLMLFLHGFPGCWFSWRHQLRHFANRYRVVAIDMRGYGESDKPSWVSDYTMDKLTGDIRGLLQALGSAKCTLVAHDWGAAVAQSFAQEHPHLVENLVILNMPHASAYRKYLAANPSQLWKSWYMFFFQLPILPELMIWNCDYKFLEDMFTKRASGASHAPCTTQDLEAYKYSFSTPGGPSPPLNYHRMAFRYEPMRMKNRRITVRTLRIWGEQDNAVEKRLAELSGDYCSDHTVNYIPTAGHSAMLDEPELVNRCMDNFLSGRKTE